MRISILVVALGLMVAVTATQAQQNKPYRHGHGATSGAPSAFSKLRNPFAGDAKVLDEGAYLYKAYCSVCHGDRGRGDGTMSRPLDPPPKDLVAILDTPQANDGFLFWVISEGGEAIDTDMVRFKRLLSDEEVWKLVTYLREGMTAK